MPKRTAHNIEEKWRSDDVKIFEEIDFSSLLLSEKLLSGLRRAGFKRPSPIQLEAIPVGRIGKDLIVQAKSGTGKTLVFTVVALETLLEVKHPQVLILAPTREIASQICDVIQAVGCRFKDLKCKSFIGGFPVVDDKPNLQDCQIAIGTPGRIKQLITLKMLKTNSIRLFILDEADELLKPSFRSDIDAIFLSLPKEKQVIATSATYPKELRKFADKYFREPFLARLNVDHLALLGMFHYTHIVPVSKMPVMAYRLKLQALGEILTKVKFSQCLVFCNILSRVESLCLDIRSWGFSATYISSCKEQAARLKAIDNLKRFKCKVLVSSDLTSRGIDAENVNLVVNFDMPSTTEVYLHRVGRGGRYGSKSACITFITNSEIDSFQTIQSDGNFKSYVLPDPIPENLINLKPEVLTFPEDELSSSNDESDDLIQNGKNDSVSLSSTGSEKNIKIVSNGCGQKEIFEQGGMDNNIENSINELSEEKRSIVDDKLTSYTRFEKLDAEDLLDSSNKVLVEHEDLKTETVNVQDFQTKILVSTPVSTCSLREDKDNELSSSSTAVDVDTSIEDNSQIFLYTAVEKQEDLKHNCKLLSSLENCQHGNDTKIKSVVNEDITSGKVNLQTFQITAMVKEDNLNHDQELFSPSGTCQYVGDMNIISAIKEVEEITNESKLDDSNLTDSKNLIIDDSEALDPEYTKTIKEPNSSHECVGKELKQQHKTETKTCPSNSQRITNSTESNTSVKPDVNKEMTGSKIIASKLPADEHLEEIIFPVIKFVNEYEKNGHCKFSAECPDTKLDMETNISKSINNAESGDNQFTSTSLSHLRSDLNQYYYNVYKHFKQDLNKSEFSEESILNYETITQPAIEAVEVSSVVSHQKDIELVADLEIFGMNQSKLSSAASNTEKKFKESSKNQSFTLNLEKRVDEETGTSKGHIHGTKTVFENQILEHKNALSKSEANLTHEADSISKDMLVSLQQSKPFTSNASSGLNFQQTLSSDSGTSSDSEDCVALLGKEFNKMMEVKRQEASARLKEKIKVTQPEIQKKKYTKKVSSLDTNKCINVENDVSSRSSFESQKKLSSNSTNSSSSTSSSEASSLSNRSLLVARYGKSKDIKSAQKNIRARSKAAKSRNHTTPPHTDFPRNYEGFKSYPYKLCQENLVQSQSYYYESQPKHDSQDCCAQTYRKSSCSSVDESQFSQASYQNGYLKRKTKLARKKSRILTRSEDQHAFYPRTHYHDISGGTIPSCRNHLNQGNLVNTHFNYQQTDPNNHFNRSLQPSQHRCHPPGVTYCHSQTCNNWYDIFYKQWQCINQATYFM